MIQARQFCQSHIDCDYASALFRYAKCFSLKYRNFVSFVCMDDKHTCKVGEPNCPIAAVERGKQVIVGLNESFQVADHDFCKLSLTPSAALFVNLPDDMEGSFYDWQVSVTLKENCFEASSPLLTELDKFLTSVNDNKEILCLYTDGGLDHTLTYSSVKLALICYFLKSDKDMIIAVRTPPYNSWKDPAERIMSILNIAMQGVGLAREKMSDKTEQQLTDCKAQADCAPGIREEVLYSVAKVKVLLRSLFMRLNLKGKSFIVQESASDEEIESLWSEILRVNDKPTRSDTTKKAIKDK